MKVLGNLDLQGNVIKQLRVDMETGFPAEPKPGRFLFRAEDRTLYVCAEIEGGLPLWVPCAQVKDMFRHTQPTAALEWVVPHGLNINPVLLQVYDSEGNWVIPDAIICTNPNSAIVRFNTPTAGIAIAIRGEMFGVRASDVAYSQDFTNQTSWVVAHGLGRNPDIKVYVDGFMVQPASIVHDSTMQATVTFTTPQSGVASCA